MKKRLLAVTRASAKAFLFSAAALLVSCATLPPAEVPVTTVYRNHHDIQFRYPSSWFLEDLSRNFESLPDAEEEGSSYIQVFSYDPVAAPDPTAPVSPSRVKIAIILSTKPENLDYPMVLARAGNGIAEKKLFRINGNTAYELRYRVPNQESAATLEILSVEYITQDLYAKFICYPWNSVHVREFEALVKSFRYRGK